MIPQGHTVLKATLAALGVLTACWDRKADWAENQRLTDAAAQHDVEQLLSGAGIAGVSVSCHTPPWIRAACCTMQLNSQQHAILKHSLHLRAQTPSHDSDPTFCDDSMLDGGVVKHSIGGPIWRPSFQGQGFGLFDLIWSPATKTARLRLRLGWE